MKKILKIVLLVLLGLILLAGVGGFLMFREEVKIISSIKPLDDEHSVFVMEYDTDYHLDELMKRGAMSDKELSERLTNYISHGFYSADNSVPMALGCSTLTTVSSEGNMVWGRNFDWTESVPIIVKSTPKEGYASISTCEFSNITGDSSAKPESMEQKFLAVAAYYVPMDGINEKGLCVADLEVNEGGMEFVDTDKINLTVTMAIRLLLNRAATVDEAIELLNMYDIAPSGGISHHLSISDATGKSVCVEFMKGEIVVVDTPYVTNFNVANGDIEAGGDSARDRYLTLEKEYKKADGVMDLSQVTSSMEKVAQKEGKWRTQWTLCYEHRKEQLIAFYYFDGEIKKQVTVTLGATIVTE